MNEAAEAGYIFKQAMGGESAVGGKEVIVAMVKERSAMCRSRMASCVGSQQTGSGRRESAYLKNLALSEVQMQAAESYLKQADDLQIPQHIVQVARDGHLRHGKGQLSAWHSTASRKLQRSAYRGWAVEHLARLAEKAGSIDRGCPAATNRYPP